MCKNMAVGKRGLLGNRGDLVAWTAAGMRENGTGRRGHVSGLDSWEPRGSRKPLDQLGSFHCMSEKTTKGLNNEGDLLA